MNDIQALADVLAILRQIDEESQRRVLQSVGAFFDIQPDSNRQSVQGASDVKPNSTSDAAHFSADRSLSPKEFMRQKQPGTDIDRVACLAYYLTHYRDTPHFNTLDISALNTESAQPKFSNASFAVNNASNSGHLVAATKGLRQLSSAGERFVELLPDKEAARAAFKGIKPRRSPKKSIAKR